jgi:hypothetical protein
MAPSTLLTPALGAAMLQNHYWAVAADARVAEEPALGQSLAQLGHLSFRDVLLVHDKGPRNRSTRYPSALEPVDDRWPGTEPRAENPPT